MKKIKLFLCVALFGAMSFGAFSAYEHLTMSDAERAIQENVEALTSGELLPSGHHTEFKRAELWYLATCTYTYSDKPSFSYGWHSMICCVDATENEACNFGLEHDECARRVIRKSRF